jgi:hypothetical protein
MIKEGLAKIPHVEIVELESSASFVFFDYVPHNGDQKYCKDELLKYNPRKLVVIDNSDEHDIFYTDDYFLYFKRSLWITEGWHRGPSPSTFRERVLPFDYGILDGYLKPEQNKNIDWGCYLRPSCYWRQLILQTLSNSKLPNSIIGQVSNGSRGTLDSEFDNNYFDHLARTKNLITCQPYYWVADSRLYEALSGRCLVFTDKLYIKHDYPFVDGQHLIEYDFSPLGIHKLWDNIQTIIDSPNLGREIAEGGYQYAKQHHTSEARMKYVIRQIKDRF